MRVLVCGDRNWTDRNLIRQALFLILQTHQNLTVIEGGCEGADLIAAEEARKLGADVLEFKADWKTYGKAAGPIRNQQMIDEGQPEFALAFHPDLTKSKGTKNMLALLRKAKIPYQHLKGNNESK